MDHYLDEMPVTVTISHKGGKDEYDLIPRGFRYRSSAISLDVKHVSPEEIESIKTPGFYTAEESFFINATKNITHYYGLFVDPDKKRDLKFFDSKDKCEEWIAKKIKTLQS